MSFKPSIWFRIGIHRLPFGRARQHVGKRQPEFGAAPSRQLEPMFVTLEERSIEQFRQAWACYGSGTP
jgi:hypothetical protein